MSDWGYGGSSSGSSSSDWGYGGSTTHKKKKKRKKPDKPDGPGDFLHNLASDVQDTITSLPRAVETVGSAFYEDMKHGGPLLSHLTTGHSAVGSELVHPAIESYRYQYGPLFDGHPGRAWKRFEEHPLGPILDVASIFSAGGGAALRGARAGALGGRAAEFANTPRTLRYLDASEEVRASNTLQGRARQAAMDKVGERYPEAPLVGNAKRIRRIQERRAHTRTLSHHRLIRQAQDAFGALTPEERSAVHVAAARVELPDRIRYFRALASKNPEDRVLQQRVAQLERIPAETLTNPRPEFVKAVNLARKVEEQAGEVAIATGKVSPESREARRFLEQRQMLTVKGDKGELAPQTESLAAREQRIVAGEQASTISPELGPAFRVPHILLDDRGKAGSFTTAKPRPGKVKDLGVFSKNRGLMLEAGRFATDPDLFTVDAARHLKYQHELDLQKDVLDPIAQPLDPSLPGGKEPGEYYYRPSRGRRDTTPIPRSVKQQEMVAQDLEANLPEHAVDQNVEARSAEVVSKHDPDAASIERLNEKGVMRIPAGYGDAYLKQMRLTSGIVRRVVDQPLDWFRFLVLGLRPAWTVNNTLGNAFLYAFGTNPVRAVPAFLRALLTLERGDDKVMQLWRWTKTRPTLRRKWGRVFEEVLPGLHQGGFYTSQATVTRAGMFEHEWQRSGLARAMRGAGKVVKSPWTTIHAVSRANVKLNQGAENLFRDATAIERVKAMTTRAERANKTLEQVVRDGFTNRRGEMLVDEVSDVLGDFNNLTRGERQIVRRIFPFYSWFKTIITVTGKLGARHPARIRMLNLLAMNLPDQELPSWLQGSVEVPDWVPVLGGKEAGVQSVIATSAINPFNTVAQLGSVAGSAFEGGAPTGTANPLGLVNPYIGALVTGATGRDGFYGGTYYGPGANRGWLGRAIGSQANLPQVALFEQLRGDRGSKLYANTPLDYALNYAGVPIKRVRTKEARKRYRAGQ